MFDDEDDEEDFLDEDGESEEEDSGAEIDISDLLPDSAIRSGLFLRINIWFIHRKPWLVNLLMMDSSPLEKEKEPIY